MDLLTSFPILPHQENRLLRFTSPSTSSTPKMDRVRFSGPSGRLTPYIKFIDFLDNQWSFDSFFDIKPVILRVSNREAGTCAIENTE